MGIPDKKVTKQILPIISQWENKLKAKGKTLVHCSAGLGRTGVFLMLAALYWRMCSHNAKGKLHTAGFNIPRLLQDMRHYRACLVQKPH
jgi:protein tyrosine phosphatase